MNTENGCGCNFSENLSKEELKPLKIFNEKPFKYQIIKYSRLNTQQSKLKFEKLYC